MTDREAIDVLFNEWKCIDRNDGIHCDRKCESCDLVMDVEIIREAYNMAISALEKQIPKKPKMPIDAYWVCPVCGKKVEHPYEHCKRCGQAIDFGGD